MSTFAFPSPRFFLRVVAGFLPSSLPRCHPHPFSIVHSARNGPGYPIFSPAIMSKRSRWEREALYGRAEDHAHCGGCGDCPDRDEPAMKKLQMLLAPATPAVAPIAAVAATATVVTATAVVAAAFVAPATPQQPQLLYGYIQPVHTTHSLPPSNGHPTFFYYTPCLPGVALPQPLPANPLPTTQDSP
jgi:hypothetical protein